MCMNKNNIAITIIGILLIVLCGGCKKIVEVPEPTNSITSSEVYSTEATAEAAVLDIYYDMARGHTNTIAYGNGLTTFDLGLAADELNYYSSIFTTTYQFQTNALLSNNTVVYSQFWTDPYFDIYVCNGVIEGVQGSTTLSASARAQLTAEAMFLRAFINFYMVNLFGEIPLVTSVNYASTEGLAKVPASQIYTEILSDLHFAQTNLPSDFSGYGGQRYRATQWAATALLARVYLYLGNWSGADSAASAVINNSGLFSLTSLDSVFLANSNEAIWQLEPDNSSRYATAEGYQNIPSPLSTGVVDYYMTKTLLNAFEPGDQRYINWVDSSKRLGTTYHFPYKYKVKTGTVTDMPEYYMMLRLGEQYLIRAEAGAQGGNNTAGAVADLNAIRIRAGLPAYAGPTDQASLLSAIAHERQIELFAEWGHRWFDLKRWGNAVSVLTTNKGFSMPEDQLVLPIPLSELEVDPNLTQNPGY
jgi:hypothetical protein